MLRGESKKGYGLKGQIELFKIHSEIFFHQQLYVTVQPILSGISEHIV